MEEEMKNLFKVCLTVFTSLCYSYFITKKIPKGKTRLFSLFPIFYLFTILPLLASSVNLRGTTAFFITWLANFKLLLFSFNQGPLSSSHDSKSISLRRFICIACLPIKIKQNQSPKSPQNTQNPSLFTNFAVNVLLFALLLRIYVYTQYIHPTLLSVLYCIHMFVALELVLAVGAALARAMLGLELEPHSNKPYLATSLQDFWGRRWNLMITGILRPTVYEPIRSIFRRVLGMKWASLPAVLATFIVSGLMHELIFYYLTRLYPTWEVTLFFVLHGICTAAEIAIKKAVAGGQWRLHPVVSGPLAMGFVAVTAIWLFLPPILKGSGVNVWGIDEYSDFLEFLKQKLDLI